MRGSALSTRVVVPAVVLAIAAALRLLGLGTPDQLYGDESYYAFDAAAYLGGGIVDPIGDHPPAVRIADEGTWVHPPLGKWIIALLGVGPIGQRPIGWRFPSAVFGIAGVALLYLLALHLWRSVWWAGFAAFLLALDGLHIVQSRMAMLDIFVTTFVTAAILFVVLDRERMHSAKRPEARWRRIDAVFGSPFRLWAGVALGAAAATKWSGAFALPFAAGLCAVWAFTSARDQRRSNGAIAGTLIASFVVTPLAVYVLSYGAFFYQHGFAIRDFLALQLDMLRYQQGHLAVQPENSAAWTWPLLLHPVRYFPSGGNHASTTILALGNPALWWGFLALIPLGLWHLVRRPEWQDSIAFGGYAVMFLPWFAIGRTQFIWYLLPAVPFMCLCVASTLRRLPPAYARGAAAVFACLVVLVAVAFMPVWLGWPTPAGWISLRWLSTWSR